MRSVVLDGGKARGMMSGAALMGFLAVVAGGCGSPTQASGSGMATGATSAAISSTAPSTAAAPTTSASEAPAAADTPPPLDPNEKRVSFNLEDASADDLLAALGTIVGKSVKVDAEAKPYMRCAKATIKSPDSITPREALARTTLALRSQGLLITTTDKDLVVSKAPDAPEKPCAKK